jgi:GNAT superfamily N-acetyltransferase
VNEVRVEWFGPTRQGDFDALHCEANGAGWCRCVAWWVPTWDGWGERTEAQNAALRGSLCDAGEYDGCLAYIGAQVVGWCQAGPRDRLPKLVSQFGLDPDAAVWAVTCFLVAPEHRRRGVARALLDAVCVEASARGASRIEAFPRRGVHDDGDAWNGPEALFVSAGFGVMRDDPVRPVLSRDV